ncbi:uncharacterized protein LOC109845499 isoform X1 [Asparagus officinalis]|uniref:uncharacterized protein LOC109845499 isoform X1 n=1 Tax=Asparagus officinalis TaxID=4686 RepID=UPI00098E4611|nr:uncharacterized protein LOC109845499 isoform X1 [Asparagus officinalis]
MPGDFIVINFFALEGWSLAELYQVQCVVAAPYVLPYSAPSSFERQFRHEFPLLFKYFQEAPAEKVSWKDVQHWMWPLFSEDWGSWRSDCLNLSPLPFMVRNCQVSTDMISPNKYFQTPPLLFEVYLLLVDFETHA